MIPSVTPPRLSGTLKTCDSKVGALLLRPGAVRVCEVLGIDPDTVSRVADTVALKISLRPRGRE